MINKATYYAPIALFVYKRPEHLRKVLDGLLRCNESIHSDLYIFSDGPNEYASSITLENIQEVRKLVKSLKGFKSINYFIYETNLGLATSVIRGINQVFEKYESVIVLEDDVVPGKYFLKYMNDSLSFYEKDDNVGCIHGFNYPLLDFGFETDTFLLRGADCWGWATWKRYWELFENDSKLLLEKILKNKQNCEFDLFGTHKYLQMLKDNIDGKINSWAINWHASLFLKNKYCLYPKKSLVINIGLDGSGTHTGSHLNLQTEGIDWMPNIKNPSLFNQKYYWLKYLYFQWSMRFLRIVNFNRICK